MIDNHIHWGNSLEIDARRVSWRRVVDMNDRALRDIVVSLGGVTNGYPRQSGFDITVASEVMAIFCLARDLGDLRRRLGKIQVAETRDRKPVYADDLDAAGAMTALLRDALMPNLVQTLEHNPAFIHGGPFANIAHGCNSVMATETALKLADFVITEAGFGADLGAEKFFNIKCRKAGLNPEAAVLVATVRALKSHGGVGRDDLAAENVAAVEKGLANLDRHISNIGTFGVPVIVGINRFGGDSDAELQVVVDHCAGLGVEAIICNHWADGGAGTEDLAHRLVEMVEGGTSQFQPLYPDDMPLWDKVRMVAQKIYGAEDIIGDKKVRDQFRTFEAEGHGAMPICMAKTQYSFSTDPELRGAPSNHVIPVNEVRLNAGAEFLVVICGGIMTMPGLSQRPAAEQIYVNEAGEIEGLF